jgi:NodT family efflux transporter outer membrane factor (OMF) lipoprotein
MEFNMRMSSHSYLLSLAMLGGLSSCTTAIDRNWPAEPTLLQQQVWEEKLDLELERPFRHELQGRMESFFEAMDCPELASYVDRCLAQSFELEAMEAQLLGAMAQAGLVNAVGTPQVGVGFQGSRRRSNSNVPRKIYQSNGQVGFSASWELDLWGKLADDRSQARQNVELRRQALLDMELSLVGTMAKAWLKAVHSQEKVRMAKSLWRLQKNLLEDAEQAHVSGRLALGSVLEQRANLSSQRSSLEAAEEELRQDKLLLMRWLGRPLDQADDLALTWPKGDFRWKGHLPVEVLHRRPDLKAAEAQWLATRYGIKSARKSRLPGMTLTGQLGTSSQDLHDLLNIEHLIWSLVGEVSAPLLQGGRIMSQIKAADASSAQALADYARTVLDALLEVEQALSLESSLLKQWKQSKLVLEARVSSEEVTALDYQRGFVEFDAYQRVRLATLQSEQALYQIQLQLWSNRVQIFLAMGGDSKDETSSDGSLWIKTSGLGTQQ